jgi:hypothetical protein
MLETLKPMAESSFGPGLRQDERLALAAQRRPEEAVLDQVQGRSKLADMDLRRSLLGPA